MSAGSQALWIGGRWYSGDDALAETRRWSRLLHGLGLRRGARLATLLPNNESLLFAWLASIERNLTLVPVNVNLVGESLRYTVEHADADLLIVDGSAVEAYRGAFGEGKPAARLLVRGEEMSGAERLEWLLAATAREALPPEPVQPADPALIIYTSGTTGLPKGVVLSRAAQRAHGVFYQSDFVRLGPGETGYSCLPLFHVTSMGFTLGCLLGGARIALDARFNPFSFWDQIRRHDARMFPYAGAMIGLLAGRPPRADDADNPAIRAIGSATPSALWEDFERRFGLTLIETYGQTELASLWLMPPPEGRRVGTIGKPVARMETRLLDAGGATPAAGEPGEIVVRPRDPLLMAQAYFRNGEATARAFRDGWYYTGDLACLDEDGYYRFAGRLKDFIRRRGENIAAYAIEREALAHPAVSECAAVGVPSDLGEEEIKLCVVLKPGAVFSAEDLARYLRPRLAQFMQPRYIDLRAELPHTATERIQKYRLVEEGVLPSMWDRHRRLHR